MTVINTASGRLEKIIRGPPETYEVTFPETKLGFRVCIDNTKSGQLVVQRIDQGLEDRMHPGDTLLALDDKVLSDYPEYSLTDLLSDLEGMPRPLRITFQRQTDAAEDETVPSDDPDTILARVFREVDLDKSGSIDAAELKTALEQAGVPAVSIEEAQKMIHHLDASETDSLNFEEFRAIGMKLLEISGDAAFEEATASAIKIGMLYKQGRGLTRWWRRPWAKRTFKLDRAKQTLEYFKGTRNDCMASKRGEIPVSVCKAEPTRRTVTRKKRTYQIFTLSFTNRKGRAETMNLAAPSIEERDEWIRVLGFQDGRRRSLWTSQAFAADKFIAELKTSEEVDDNDDEDEYESDDSLEEEEKAKTETNLWQRWTKHRVGQGDPVLTLGWIGKQGGAPVLTLLEAPEALQSHQDPQSELPDPSSYADLPDWPVLTAIQLSKILYQNLTMKQGLIGAWVYRLSLRSSEAAFFFQLSNDDDAASLVDLVHDIIQHNIPPPTLELPDPSPTALSVDLPDFPAGLPSVPLPGAANLPMPPIQEMDPMSPTAMEMRIPSPGADLPVVPLPAVDLASPPTPPAPTEGTILYEYEAKSTEEISAAVGDHFVLEEDYGDGWSRVALKGQAGSIPTSWLKFDEVAASDAADGSAASEDAVEGEGPVKARGSRRLSAALLDRVSMFEENNFVVKNALQHQDSFNEVLEGLHEKLHQAIAAKDGRSLRNLLAEADEMEADSPVANHAVLIHSHLSSRVQLFGLARSLSRGDEDDVQGADL